MALGRDEIDKRLGFHPATPETGALHIEVRRLCSELGYTLDELLPDGREKSCAFTALQEVAMWSNAAIACNLAPLKLGE